MTKYRILEMLMEKDGFVSGEEMSRSLGVSRAAVSKAVKSLKLEGYGIEAHTNAGYRIHKSVDVLNSQELSRYLEKDAWGKIVYLPSVNSTNTAAKALAEEGAADRTLVIADRQTGGRGRFGRQFQSDSGKGVWMSLILRPQLSAGDSVFITILAAVAVVQAIEKLCGLKAGIKWTNDIYLNGKKLCGILTEMSTEAETGRVQYIVLGIGVNVNQTGGDFPPDIQMIATSLREACGSALSRARLAGLIANELSRLIAAGWLTHSRKALIETYRESLFMLGREITVRQADSVYPATALDIDEDARLIIKTSDGRIQAIGSGEVSIQI